MSSSTPASSSFGDEPKADRLPLCKSLRSDVLAQATERGWPQSSSQSDPATDAPLVAAAYSNYWSITGVMSTSSLPS